MAVASPLPMTLHSAPLAIVSARPRWTPTIDRWVPASNPKFARLNQLEARYEAGGRGVRRKMVMKASKEGGSGVTGSEWIPRYGGTNIGTRVGLGILWIAYMWFVLLTPDAPGKSALEFDPAALKEATALSLNFWFVLPTLLPQVAPVIHPMLEGLFEALVTWSVLFFGFISENRTQKINMIGFLVGSSFLTNIFYIPYLALREEGGRVAIVDESDEASTTNSLQNSIQSLVENKVFGPIVGGMATFAIAWALFARPEFGDIGERSAELKRILSSDRLAYSFAVDMGIFALLQTWMVPDEMKRRGFDDSRALLISRIPLFGLAYYMAIRPPLSSDST
ncbi:hypothetical protein AAMO2058_000918300 [Amorphochlora amoebiformis]